MNRTVSTARSLIKATIISMLLLLPAMKELHAQPKKKLISIPKTYAVVIGISDYSSKGIRKLQFANRDAEEFAAYLKSVAVPPENIRLLTDAQATTAAIYDALNWLVETCGENDIVFFYFSGHGDMENTTIYKLGFLLAQNTPRNNFINNALRIEDLNNVANTLSVVNKAKVVLITDACHSGKLTGAENKGKFLVGEQLRTSQQNEIRITSCAADELSAENEEWGGGRGVFSYYLVNGLMGLAENKNDGFVTLEEIKTFMDSSFAHDAVLRKENLKQTPVIPVTNNNAGFRLATVNHGLLLKATAQVSQDRATQESSDDAGIVKDDDLLSLNPVDYFFIMLNEKKGDGRLLFSDLNNLDASMIPAAIIRQINTDSFFAYINKDKLRELELAIGKDPEDRQRFMEQWVVLIHDRVQHIINLYLEADAAELEKRRYYNVYSSGYDIYPVMLSVALKLAGPTHLLRHIMEVNRYYLLGVTARLKIPTVKDPSELIATAMVNMEKAYALEKEAPYILNELGILYRIKKQPAKALEFYKKAADLSSEWALPWANMSGAYIDLKNYKEGFATAAKAKELDPGLQSSYVNAGILYEKMENYLLAEEEFRESIKINTRHYLAFEHLGNVYMNTARYALADSFFLEAELRKRGFNFMDATMDGVFDQFDMMQNPVRPPCPIVTSRIGKKDILGNFAWGMQYVNDTDWVNAENKFKEVIALDPTNPLAFHYLGTILYKQQRWAEADLIFNAALENHLDTVAFSRYVDSLIKLIPAYNNEHCVVKNFKESYYERTEDRYYLAAAYEQWNHFAEAEKQYRLIIGEMLNDIGGYYKLWRLFEKTGRYNDAEETIRSYATIDRERSERERNSFYKRMMERLPEKQEWFYKAGNFLYKLCQDDPVMYQYDRKSEIDDQDKENYTNQRVIDPNDAAAKIIFLPGTKERVWLPEEIINPLTDGITYLIKAESMTQEAETIAEINLKIGDMYCWQGLPRKASAFYKRSVDLFPADANTRIKLLDTYTSTYQMRNALEQLDSLNERKEINYPKMLQMAEFCAYAHRFTDGGSLLKTAEEIYPFHQPEIVELNGRLKLLEKQPKAAIVYYKDHLSFFPGNAETMYNLARLNAMAGNSTEAWKWLRSSLKNGFRYSYVLMNDDTWNKMRLTPQWKQLLKDHDMLKYPGSD